MNIFKTFFIFLSVMGIISCNPNSKSDDNETLALLALAMPQTVNLNFEALANGQALVTGSNITADSRPVQFRDFRLYISEVKLVKADGSTADVTLSTDNVWQSNGVALVDLETTQTVETNTKVSGTAPTGNYTGVQFSVGVPETLNHMDSTTQKAPLNISSMYWSWTGGYKHSKIEFTYNSGTDWTSLHIGSTTCSGAPNYGNCSKKFRASIQLTGQFNSANQKISLDVDKLINGHTFGAMGMCMPGDGSAACLPLIRAFGLNESNGAADGTYSQRIFSLK
ncbi:metallo-mystery pair system four-Cys motif protein [Leptospira meyeri]|uniref:MbnP family copper-binding protein n=1 Tax=Leptospira meyeri TaxID=29508 RepID=UPI00108247B3|nr:MbnP family copper-binding protein [Leptospira meyeri]MCW7488047.1 metallo-mystery pair system four-Cys motif protein [Leptospira meyeri]TGL15481.1 metallo-mystery pair system four-Cys motif protein [Leptospira meyeri]TGM63729.1 metallo-mystery pair system four-Cys motif protein [Leptospira meyeri]TGM67800.1 metallo-mystery pair system four-Cys motif protein [Leptospira meyeri]